MQRSRLQILTIFVCALAWLVLSNQAFADDTDPPAAPGYTSTTPTTSNGTSTSTVGTSTSSTNSGPTETVAFVGLAIAIYLIWQKRRQLIASKL